MGTPLVAQSTWSFTPQTLKEPHLTHAPPGNPEPWGTCLGCKTESSVESTSKVSGSPTISERTSRRRGSRKRRNLLTRRWNEEGYSPATPGNRCEKNLWVSRKNERSLSTPRSCWKSASAMTSESESRLRDS